MSAVLKQAVDYAGLIEESRVHASLYASPQVFADEMDRIFSRGWVYVGHESEVPEPGDYCLKNLGHQSMILTRHGDGRVYVLHNRCAHRGARVLQAERGRAEKLVCMYHGWSYRNDGSLAVVPSSEGYGPGFDTRGHGLARAARVESYGGFVFASLAERGITLQQHLGHAVEMIDMLNGLSPAGRLDLRAGWMKHRMKANWKMIVENQVDGYHAPFVHNSLLRANRRFATVRDRKESSPARVRDLGDGHSDIDHASDYRTKGTTLRWTGGIEESRLPNYVAAMKKAYGEEGARLRLIDGPPHAMIWPNLFLAEMSIMIVEPVAADETVHYTTPVQLVGAEELNGRSMRRGEAATGPAGFLIADDAEIAELAQRSAANLQPEWLLISRGLHSEEKLPDGTRSAGLMDECPQRGFWRQYRKVMTEAA